MLALALLLAALPAAASRVGAAEPRVGAAEPRVGAAEPRVEGTTQQTEGRCTYTASVWNAKRRASTRVVKVDKPRSQLRAEEKGALGCTPCSEDQREVVLSNGIRFSACSQAADRLRTALEGALADGAVIRAVVGYRAQYSKGELNAKGERTELSNHAFGVAVDVNEGSNGLYDRCLSWGPGCRLIKAGRWRADDPLSHRPDHPVVRRLKAEGFKWGGEIAGRQKDFMHFSPTGY